VAGNEHGDLRAQVAALRAELAFAWEFRVPLPEPAPGAFAIVVRREPGGSDRWAVTDGADTGLRAWVDGRGWQYVSDIGRAAAYRHEREEALRVAYQVAELEGADAQG
jgi:hypothetical protein